MKFADELTSLNHSFLAWAAWMLSRCALVWSLVKSFCVSIQISKWMQRLCTGLSLSISPWLSSQLPHLFTHLGAQFCRSAVEPMGEESDHVHITALSDALGVPVRVVYLDRSGDTDDKPAEVNHHDFIPVGSPQTTVDPFVVLLYRPGHYDILYTKQE